MIGEKIKLIKKGSIPGSETYNELAKMLKFIRASDNISLSRASDGGLVISYVSDEEDSSSSSNNTRSSSSSTDPSYLTQYALSESFAASMDGGIITVLSGVLHAGTKTFLLPTTGFAVAAGYVYLQLTYADGSYTAEILFGDAIPSGEGIWTQSLAAVSGTSAEGFTLKRTYYGNDIYVTDRWTE